MLLKRHRKLVYALGSGAIAVIAGVTILIIVELHMREERAEKVQLGAFDTLLAEQTARAVETVEIVVGQVVDDLRHNGMRTAKDFDALRNDAPTYEYLRQRIANLPQLEALTLDSNAGRLINMSRYYPIPDVYIGDREYFRRLADNPSLTTAISTPLRNRGTGTWNIYLARRINGDDGEFVGLVLGAMRLEYFERLYESISMAGGTSICLWREDGTLLARYPRTDTIGQRVASRSFLQDLPAGETVIHTAKSTLDRQTHMFAVRKLLKNGLVVEVSQTLDEVFADWRHDAVIVGLAGTACILAAWLMMLGIIRQFQVYDSMELAVAAREEAVQARHRAEERLIEAQKMEAIGRLTSGIAHDFNNLLASVTGNAELLLRDKLLGPHACRRVSVIQQAADRGAALVRQLLAFSRQQVLTPVPLVLDQTLNDMVDLMQGVLGSTVHLNIVSNGGIWPVLVDPTQFEYMILNVAVNARDAMPDGGVLTIEIRDISLADSCLDSLGDNLVPGDYVMITMSDTGTGMPADVLRRAFDPFFTTKPTGRGTGLGLSQVYGLATQSGGRAQLQSTPGKGTTVTIFLPRFVEQMAST